MGQGLRAPEAGAAARARGAGRAPEWSWGTAELRQLLSELSLGRDGSISGGFGPPGPGLALRRLV